MSRFSSFFRAVVDLMYPVNCAACDRPLVAGEKCICLACRSDLPVTGFHRQPDNAAYRRLYGRVPIQQAASFLYFTKGGVTQHLIHGLKYAHRQRVGAYLGALWAATLLDDNWLRGIDALVPVPLHAAKLRQRGFNQAKTLAEGMADVAGLPLCHALTKVKNTDSQTHKSLLQRLENMDGAFVVSDPIVATNRHVLLIDDVLTTGATLESCAKALLSVPGVKISIATLAIAMD